MKIVYLYWPPAVWKLTTAKELSKRTNYKIFHNHLSHDLVSSVINYEENKDIFFPIIKDLNLFFLSKIPDTLEWLIITNCYEGWKDDNYINEIIKIFSNRNIKIYFIRLETWEETLLKRVENNDRKNTTKLKNRTKLKEILKTNNYLQNIKWVGTLVINNTDLQVENVVDEIIEYIK
jgi:hypothetical protein